MGDNDPVYDQTAKGRAMTKRRELFEFVIDALTPDVLPMARFAEYVGKLASMLGEKEHVHFVALKPGSSRLVHAVDDDSKTEVSERLANVRARQGDADAIAAYDAIDMMLRTDRSKGEIRRQGDHEPTGRLLFFPGASRPADEEFGPFKQQAQIYGVPIGVGGRSTIVNVNIKDGSKVHYCEATQDVALLIAPLMFRHTIRAYGTGKYFRDADGAWDMQAFRISHFDALETESMIETVSQLRNVTKRVGLPNDIIARLTSVRDESEV